MLFWHGLNGKLGGQLAEDDGIRSTDQTRKVKKSQNQTTEKKTILIIQSFDITKQQMPMKVNGTETFWNDMMVNKWQIFFWRTIPLNCIKIIYSLSCCKIF